MYIQFPSLKELSKNHDIWVQVLFSSLSGRVGFGWDSCTFFTFGFEFGSVRFGSALGKIRVLVRFVLAEFRFFPISNSNSTVLPARVEWR